MPGEKSPEEIAEEIINTSDSDDSVADLISDEEDVEIDDDEADELTANTERYDEDGFDEDGLPEELDFEP